MDGCKASKFPFLYGIKLGEIGDSPLVDCSLYRQLVGSLLYLTHTRPDLAYDFHWKESQNILPYFQGTRSFGVHYATSSPLELVGFSDSDWDGHTNDRQTNSCFDL